MKSPAAGPAEGATAWYARLRDLRLKLAIGLGVVALIFALVMWFSGKLLSIDPGKGTPIGWSVRTGGHIATLTCTLEAYIPSPARDHGKDTYSISLFLVPLDGSKPGLVPISGGHSGNALGLMRILGGAGNTIWFDVNGVGGVDVESYTLLRGAALRDPTFGDLEGALPDRLTPRIGASLSTGTFINDREWFGILSMEEAQREYAPGKWLRTITHAESARHMRRFYRGTVGDDTGGSRKILAMGPVGEGEYLDGAFLRIDDKSAPIRLQDPDGLLMIHTSEPGLRGTLVMSRVDTQGRIIWKVDTGIDRFKLSQILPGDAATAFVGTRLPVPDKVPEPLLVIVEHATGAVVSHSLWQ